MKIELGFCALATCLLLFFSACETDDVVTTDGDDTETETDDSTDPIDVESCASLSGIEQVICLAEAFTSQLDDSQLSAVQLTYSVSTAKKWSNFPEAMYGQRPGLDFGSMNTTQIQYAKALLEAASGTVSNEGWDELQQLLNADDYLGENGGGSTYGSENYYIALLGTPATTGTFEIQFGGHHLAFANTYVDGLLVGGTPSFRAVEPFDAFSWDGETNQPMVQERDALAAMLNSLSSAQLTTAKLSSSFGDLLAGPQSDNNFPATPSGIACSELSSDQQALVLEAIATYVQDIDDENAATFMTLYTNELPDTYLAYAGNTGLASRNDYVRIDGPSVWIEYSVQGGVILSGTHPHSVWRDKNADYGGN